MAPAKPRFDPTAYAELKKKKIEHAKEIRELRSSMFAPVSLTHAVSGKRRATSEAGSVNGGSLASSRGASPTRSFSSAKAIPKDTSGIKKSNSLSNLSGADAKSPLKSKTVAKPTVNAKQNKPAFKPKTNLARTSKAAPPLSSPASVKEEKVEKSPRRLKPMLEDEPYSEPVVASHKTAPAESKSEELDSHAEPKSSTKKSGILYSLKNSFRFFRKSSKAKEEAGNSGSVPSRSDSRDVASSPSSLKNVSRKDSYSDSHSSRKILVAEKPKSQEFSVSDYRDEGLTTKSGSDLRKSIKSMEKSTGAPSDPAKPLTKQTPKGVRDSKNPSEKSKSDATKKVQKAPEKKTREVKSLESYMESANVKCNECGRTFKPESLEKHSAICKKVFGSKRKTFDSSKVRKKAFEELNPVSASSR